MDEKIDADIEDIENIIQDELGIGLSPRNGIYDARRLGTRKTDKPRSVKIVFDNIDTKRDVLRCAKHLRRSSDPIAKKLYINPDLTKEQRAADKLLREEMWKRRNQNENVVIRQGKLVTIPFRVNNHRRLNNNTASNTTPTNSANASHGKEKRQPLTTSNSSKDAETQQKQPNRD